MEKAEVRMEVPYFQVPNEIFEVGLDKHELVVYFYLARCGNHGGTAFPSYATIAKKCGMSRRKAIDAVESLVLKKLLRKSIRYNSDRQENYTNIYEVEHNIKGSAQHALGSAGDAPGSAQHAPNKELAYKEPDNKNTYAFLAKSEQWLRVYNDTHVLYRGRNHKNISNDNAEYITYAIEQLRELDIDDQAWTNAVTEYFENLPTSNDGDILAFLKATMRYLEVKIN